MNELILKTAICCMACDGHIAEEEIVVLKQSDALACFSQQQIASEIEKLQVEGKSYIKRYIDTLASAKIDNVLVLAILNIAVEMIKSDNVIEYEEIKFFKLIKNSLKLTNEFVLHNIKGIDEDWVEDDILSYQQVYNQFFIELNLTTIHDYKINLSID